MRLFKIDKNTLTQDLIGFLGIASGFFQLFQVVVKDEKINEFVLIFCIICFLAYFIITKRQKKTPLRNLDDYFLIPHFNYDVGQVQVESELEQIVALARANYSCPINEMDFKKPIWQKNPFTFFIVKDDAGDVRANINLLPLTEDAYNRLKAGSILESELTANDVLGNTDEEKNKCRYIYVEGLLSKSEDGSISDKNALILIGWNFEKIVSNLASNLIDTVYCGIGGSIEGENLMKRLGFHIAVPAEKRKDKLDFFVVDFNKLKQNLDNKTLVGTIKKIISKT
ncbi:hypothetical protein [Pedobacter mendelii]|uniref:Uncharacterized protein n=1 Tax=Pedobacter mendelii TaxID=1908240 RepID=A0ABQ2BEP1_9SPHI|nr:hypothetical protein [Pedobacter mendelii]GGI24378.1 hypothetical protein GCM10008119_12360 [Pedobacter mendelii]